jgi:hypothetical protein
MLLKLDFCNSSHKYWTLRIVISLSVYFRVVDPDLFNPDPDPGIFPQSGSGSTQFLNSDPMRIRIHKGKFENKYL